ncbi:hypothetical protein [uncultured Pseudoalteromonas sp.]|uniref:hypothetical protein n=1 Tax=uncultured Pseudoalteromonas sp. TaxID=114053 RepID=UPI00258BEC03|nr:hypothetical protein [uncultured Pseudoalteromonas sp.]
MRTSLLPVFLFSVFLAACDSQSIEEGSTTTSCENNSRCHYPNNDEIWLSNSDISPETPFTINLKVPSDAKNLSAKLEGVTMYMGFIPLQFKKSGQLWAADTMVGACSESVMTWKMTVTYINADDQPQTLFYYFDSLQSH